MSQLTPIEDFDLSDCESCQSEVDSQSSDYGQDQQEDCDIQEVLRLQRLRNGLTLTKLDFSGIQRSRQALRFESSDSDVLSQAGAANEQSPSSYFGWS